MASRGANAWVLIAIVGCGARSRAAEGDGIGLGDSDADADSDLDSDADVGSDTPDGELDLGPDARPSDYPDADDWRDADPSKLEPGEACCDLVGDAIELDGDQNAAGPPVVAWNGEGWGVAWGPIVFRALDALAVPLGDIVTIDDASRVTSLALEWGNDRYAVAASGWRSEWAEVGMLDRDGALLTPLTALGEDLDEPDIARYRHGHGWVLGYLDERQYYDAEITVRWVDDDATVDVDDHVVGRAADGRGPRVVGLASRASVVWSRDDGVWHRSFAWPAVAAARAEQRVLAMGTYEDTSIEAVAYRDYTAAAAMDGRDVRVVLVDPWEDAVVGGPSAVAASPISDRRPGLAPVDERGYLGLCYETGPASYGGGGDDGVAFLLVGADATRWGEEVEVIGGLRNIGGCAVGWSGEEFIVVWWEAALENNRIFAQRVRPRI